MANMGQKTFGTQWILGGQYFLYFGVMGLFLPFFNLYCYHLGFNGFQIGILSAVKTVIGVIFPLLWSILADQRHNRREIYIFCNIVSALLWGLFFMQVDFFSMVVIMIAYSIFYSPIIAFLETLTMSALGHERNSYGHIRVWGSVGFILSVLVLGKLIDIYSVNMIIILIFAGSLMQALLSPMIPSPPPEERSQPVGNKGFFNSQMIVFLVAAFLMLLSHGTYYGFFSIHLEKLGYGGLFIGVAWAVASFSEIIIMLKSHWIFKRFSFHSLIVCAMAVSACRWLIVFYAVSPVLILLSQVLHAFTYGVFHIASILYIDSLSTPASKTFGQAVNNAVTYGLGMMVGFLVNGYFYDRLGAGLFVFSSGCGVAAAMIFYFFSRKGSEEAESAG